MFLDTNSRFLITFGKMGMPINIVRKYTHEKIMESTRADNNIPVVIYQ